MIHLARNVKGIFEAELFPTKVGVPGVRLFYRQKRSDPRILRIHIVPIFLVDYFEWLPYAYQFIEGTDERPYPTIKIIAGPGVHVALENYPEPQTSFINETTGIPWVHVIRVQNTRLIPGLGDYIVTENYVRRYEVGKLTSLRLGEAFPPTPQYKEDYFVVEAKNSSLTINHFYHNLKYTLSVPAYTTKLSDISNATCRYAIDIKNLAETRGDPQLVTAVISGNVKFEVSRIYKHDAFRSTDPRLLLNTINIYETPNLQDVPPQGGEITVKKHWTIPEVHFPVQFELKDAELEMLKFMLDITIGMIPIVGDVVDICEFLYALVTGKDKWGDPVTEADLFIMGIGALLPFASGSALKQAARISRKFNNYTPKALEIIEALENSKLSKELGELIADYERLKRAGLQIPKKLAEALNKRLAKIIPPSKSLDDLLNPDGSGFIDIELNEAYEAYKVKKKIGFLPPREWALRQTTGSSRQLLERRLGKDYVRVTRAIGNSKKIKHLDAIPKPADYPKKLLDSHLTLCRENKTQLFERLEKFRRELFQLNSTLRERAIKEVNEGLLRIFKGNIGEILSKPIQMKILKRIATKHPDVHLITGIRIQLGDNKSVLFSDNIYASFEKGRLVIRGVVEVKAGQRGGSAARDQIFEWIEGRIEEGAKLIIPKGAKIFDRKGRQIINAFQREYVYSPKKRVSSQVFNLINADRYAITAKGMSHFGLNSAHQVAANVKPIEMDVQSDQIDYLVRLLFPSLLSN